MTRPLLLDLFCGAGGAAVGYHRSGFDVIGVDINPQPDYPFMFIQSDALEELRDPTYARTRITVWKRFFRKPAAIHASPPCQHYTYLQKGTNRGKRQHPVLIEPTRELLQATGLPYVIENVCGSPLIDPIRLCGEMFGLDVIRHRLFESNIELEQPHHITHRGRVRGWRYGQYFDGPYVAVYGKGGGKASVTEAQAAMRIDWTNDRVSLNEAIPPAYTEYIGAQLIDALEMAA